MRWQRLTAEERRVVGVAGVDALGALAMSLDCWHEAEAIYVSVIQLTAHVDESGTEEPRMMLAALAARSYRWFDFAAHWRKKLKRAKIPYSHIVDMENGKPPFEGWGDFKTRRFVAHVLPLIHKHCDFGQTVALDIEAHKTEYHARLSDKVHKDSAYGLCARAMIEGITLIAIQRFGRNIRVNFIFENSQHYGAARDIFNDCKNHLNNIKNQLGTITPGEKTEFGALQAADIIASIGRRLEKETVFRTADLDPETKREFEEGCPLYHVPLGEDHLPGYCQQAEEIAAEKRWNAKKRRKAKKGGSA